MPELPEVETLRRGLEREVSGRRILGAVVANAKVLKEQTEAAFRQRIIGKRIEQIDRRGKYLLFSLGDVNRSAIDGKTESNSGDSYRESDVFPTVSPFSLCIHLKMRGQLLLQSAEVLPAPYHCVSLLLDNGLALRFHDMWTWGEIRVLTPTEVNKTTGLGQMGKEPLSTAWDAADLFQKLKGRSTPVKTLLLDQRVVAGVGNIYADESLFRAGIHPERHGRSLTLPETERLVNEVRAVLTEAVTGGGTTSEDYVDLAGQPGRYTPRVYDRSGKPCVVCGTSLSRIRLGGRGTVYCSRCQANSAIVS